jgi:hypothetical protein
MARGVGGPHRRDGSRVGYGGGAVVAALIVTAYTQLRLARPLPADLITARKQRKG